MLMMLPASLASIICLAAARATSQAPLRLVSMILSHSPASRSSAERVAVTPELLTTMRGRAQPLRDLGEAALDAVRDRSRPWRRRWPLSPPIVATLASSCSLRRAASATLAPAPTSVRAKCRPSPPEAPVTRATLPLRSKLVSHGATLQADRAGRVRRPAGPGRIRSGCRPRGSACARGARACRRHRRCPSGRGRHESPASPRSSRG